MACPRCAPELAPTGPRRHAQHFATRFEDWSQVVRKDGKVIPDAYEVDVRLGLAWRFAKPLRRCACGGRAEAYIDTGGYQVFEPYRGRQVAAAVADRERWEAEQVQRLTIVRGLDERTRRAMTGEVAPLV